MFDFIWPWYDRCAWCRSTITDISDIITITFTPEENIPYDDSGQYIDRIIFLSLEEEPLTFANIFKDEDTFIEDKKTIPVFPIPFRDDDNNFAVKTCSRECAELVKTALKNEKYIFEWNFEENSK